MAKPLHYDGRALLEHNADYSIVYGERSNGKSYFFKYHALSQAYEERKITFGLVRRWADDIKTSYVKSYFVDSPIEAITHGEYNIIDVYSGTIYFANYDTETGKIIRGIPCGKTFALNIEERYKSQEFPDIKTLIFEEFITSGKYLGADEGDHLLNLVSTIFRRRQGRVICIGNTLSRLCPYYGFFGIGRGVKRQQSGTIDDYYLATGVFDEDGNEQKTKISVEYAPQTESKTSMFWGQKSKSVNGGAWECKVHPRKPDGEWDVFYELLLNVSGYQWVVQLLGNDDGQLILYVYPFTGCRKFDRIIQREFSPNPLINPHFNPEVRPEKIMLDLIKNKKVCSSDNLTGEEFEQVITTLL